MSTSSVIYPVTAMCQLLMVFIPSKQCVSFLSGIYPLGPMCVDFTGHISTNGDVCQLLVVYIHFDRCMSTSSGIYSLGVMCVNFKWYISSNGDVSRCQLRVSYLVLS